MSNKLSRILKEFEKRQKDLPAGREERIQKLADLFKPIAKHLLSEGCLSIFRHEADSTRVPLYS